MPDRIPVMCCCGRGHNTLGQCMPYPTSGHPHPNQTVAVWPPINATAAPPIYAWTPQSNANCTTIFIHPTKLVQMQANVGAVLPWSWTVD